MNGASADPWAKTSRAPTRSITTTMGSSHHFFAATYQVDGVREETATLKKVNPSLDEDRDGVPIWTDTALLDVPGVKGDAQVADGALLSSGGLRRHDRAEEHAVLPVVRLGHQRHRLATAATEQDRRDRHARRIFPLGRDRGALRRRRGDTASRAITAGGRCQR